MAPVGQKHFGRRHRRQQVRRPPMVSDVASGAEQAAGAPLAVANGMQPRVQPAFGASDMPGRAPAEQTGRRSVRLQMGRVDHEFRRLGAALCRLDEDAPEHAQPAPADEALADRLVRPVAWRNVAPPQAIADDEDDAADDPPVNPPEAYYETTEGTEKSAPYGRPEAGSGRSWRHPLHCRR